MQMGMKNLCLQCRSGAVDCCQNGARFHLCAQVNMPYHIRVLVPCYKESYDIVTRTLEVCCRHTS